MSLSRRSLVGAAAATAMLASQAKAQANRAVRIGVLSDQSGQFRDLGGMGSVAAVRQAVKDFGDHGLEVDVIFADHQNKPDVGAAIARQWCDSAGVDMLINLPNSAVALAVSDVVRGKNKVMITSAAGTSELTGSQCSPNTIQWTFDTYMLAKATSMASGGGDTWFLIYADFAYGQQIARDITRFVTADGGKMVGAAAYPVAGTTDF